jgi:hypothetical protein
MNPVSQSVILPTTTIPDEPPDNTINDNNTDPQDIISRHPSINPNYTIISYTKTTELSSVASAPNNFHTPHKPIPHSPETTPDFTTSSGGCTLT